jgi:hypothetical protein
MPNPLVRINIFTEKALLVFITVDVLLRLWELPWSSAAPHNSLSYQALYQSMAMELWQWNYGNGTEAIAINLSGSNAIAIG